MKVCICERAHVIHALCQVLVEYYCQVFFSIQLIRNILRQSHISIDVILRSSRSFRVQASAPQDKTVHTFRATMMDRSFHKVVSSHILRFAIAMRAFTSLEQSQSVDIFELFYFSTGSLLTRNVIWHISDGHEFGLFDILFEKHLRTCGVEFV